MIRQPKPASLVAIACPTLPKPTISTAGRHRGRCHSAADRYPWKPASRISRSPTSHAATEREHQANRQLGRRDRQQVVADRDPHPPRPVAAWTSILSNPLSAAPITLSFGQRSRNGPSMLSGMNAIMPAASRQCASSTALLPRLTAVVCRRHARPPSNMARPSPETWRWSERLRAILSYAWPLPPASYLRDFRRKAPMLLTITTHARIERRIAETWS